MTGNLWCAVEMIVRARGCDVIVHLVSCGNFGTRRDGDVKYHLRFLHRVSLFFFSFLFDEFFEQLTMFRCSPILQHQGVIY